MHHAAAPCSSMPSQTSTQCRQPSVMVLSVASSSLHAASQASRPTVPCTQVQTDRCHAHSPSWIISPRPNLATCAKRGRPKSTAPVEAPVAPAPAGTKRRGRPPKQSSTAAATPPPTSQPKPKPTGWDAALVSVPGKVEEDDIDLLVEGEEGEAGILEGDIDEFDEDELDETLEDMGLLGRRGGRGEEEEGEEDEAEELLDEDETLDVEVIEEENPDRPSKDASGVPLKYLTYQEALELTTAVRGNELPDVKVLTAEEIRAMEEAEAARTAIVVPEGAQLTLNRQGYQAFQMDNVELLVAETADGKIDLRDSFVFDTDSSIYSPPEIQGKLPPGPVHLQVIPWVQRKTADTLKQKPAMEKMKRVYFLGVASLRPYQVDLNTVYCFDAATRKLSKEPVVWEADVKDPVLRIRPDGIIVQDTGRAPPPKDVSFQQPGSHLTEEEKEALLQQRIEELEAEAEQLDELDEAPDLPEADSMM